MATGRLVQSHLVLCAEPWPARRLAASALLAMNWTDTMRRTALFCLAVKRRICAPSLLLDMAEFNA